MSQSFDNPPKFIYYNSFADDRASIVIPAGDIVIHQVDATDEGIYRCTYTGGEAVEVALRIYGE